MGAHVGGLWGRLMGAPGALWGFAQGWSSARRLGRGTTRATFDAAQLRAMRAWARRGARLFPRAARPFETIEGFIAGHAVMDKAATIARFADLHVLGLAHDAALARVDAGQGGVGLVELGSSTGTSGTRGVYAVDAADRARWVGAMFGYCRPSWGDRVAVVLPRPSSLYDAAGLGPLLQVRFFSAVDPPLSWIDALEAFRPDHLIAAPRVLRWIREHRPHLAPRRKIWAAGERLDGVDAKALEGWAPAFGQIYMATEGVLAVTCGHGRLHLCEDSTFFEFEDAGGGAVRPLVSGFRRRAQWMARYRMNDRVVLDPMPCPCGSVFRTLASVEGRDDDTLHLVCVDGSTIAVFPSAVRDALMAAVPHLTDFRVVQQAGSVEAVLPPAHAADAPAVHAALCALWARHAARVETVVVVRAMEMGTGKLSRVRGLPQAPLVIEGKR